MGKCSKCREKDASYCDINGKRKFCKDCAPNGSMTKRQRLQLPEKLDIETLPSQPAIIKSVLHVVKTHCPNAEDVLEAAGREWTPETTIILDVSTNSRSANVNEEKANQIKNFIFDNPQDVSVCVNIARAFH